MTRTDPRAIGLDELKEEPSPSAREALRIFVSEEAFDRAVARGAADTTREVGGVLVGVVRRDALGPYVRVDSTIDALHAEEKGAELTFTHATWDHVHKEMDSRHAGKKVVGWYHTHPGFGVFLSDRDEFIHKSFFDLPFQIALVYDPKSREHGVFAWRDGAPWRVRRYFVGGSEHLWDGNRERRRTAQEVSDEVRAEVKTAKAAEPEAAAGARLDVPALAFAAVVGVLLGAVGGWWFGGREVADVVRRAEAETAQARAVGARDAVASLNGDLLALLRATVSHEALTRSMEGMIADLDRALSLVRPAPPLLTAGAAPAAAAELAPLLEAVRAQAQKLRDERRTAAAALSAIEVLAAAKRADPSAAQVALTANVLGGLYADLAMDLAQHGDAGRARRYLAIAAKVDPGNRERYESLLAAIDRNGKVEGP